MLFVLLRVGLFLESDAGALEKLFRRVVEEIVFAVNKAIDGVSQTGVARSLDGDDVVLHVLGAAAHLVLAHIVLLGEGQVKLVVPDGAFIPVVVEDSAALCVCGDLHFDLVADDLACAGHPCKASIREFHDVVPDDVAVPEKAVQRAVEDVTNDLFGARRPVPALYIEVIVP